MIREFAVRRSYIFFVLAVLFVLEPLSWTGICFGPSSSLISAAEASINGFLAISSRLGLLAIIFLTARLALQAKLVALVSGVLFVVAADRSAPDPFDWLNQTILWFLDGASIAALLMLAVARLRQTAEREMTDAVGYGALVAILFTLVPPCLLSLSSSLHPATFDLFAYHIDAALGFSPSQFFASAAQSFPSGAVLLRSVYVMLPAALAAFYGLQISNPARAPISIFEFMIVSGTVATLCYALYPITGPAYIFGADFPNGVAPLGELPLGMAVVDPAPRNGMPSMHAGWALALWLMSRHMSRRVQMVYGVILAMTSLAVLTTGEHYLIDVFVAFPVVGALLAFCSRRLPWRGVRGRTLAWGLGLYLVWVLALRIGPVILMNYSLVLWALVAVTSAISFHWIGRLQQANAATLSDAPAAEVAAPDAAGSFGWTIPAMFFVSGAAALIYQVLFSKQLAHVFGSMSTATNTVLATYMGGMAIGAWAGGMLAGRLRQPLLAFALCEFAIGGYCAMSGPILHAVQGIYVSWATGVSPDSAALLYMRVMLGVSVLLIPTVTMGMTLPILVRYFEQRRQAVGVSAGRLYAANTLGAAAGALAAGYLVIPALGLGKTVLFAVACNLTAVFLAISANKNLADIAESEADQGPDHRLKGPVTHAWAALLALTVGGFITMGLEVGFIHLLAVAAGNSTYAFSLMLFAFLVGLGGGAEIGRRLLQRFEPVQLLVWLQMALAGAIVAGLFRINALPGSFADYELYQGRFEFGAREIIRGLGCLLAMVPPALVIGAIFPVAIEAVTRGYHTRPLRMLGIASALNTLGNIGGVLVAGFILVPTIGSFSLVQILAALTFCMGLGIAVFLPQARNRWFALPVSLALLLLWAQPAKLDYDALTTGANVYFRAQTWGHVIDHAESLDGGLTTVNEGISQVTGERELTLLTNGKFQGNDVKKGEMIAQMAFAVAPLLHTDKRDAALVIGYGTGNTSKVLHDAGFASLDIADLSADIYTLANRHLSSVNDRVTEKPNVHAYVTDGRNYLMLTQQNYDMISMEVSSIWFAGAATLYNRDFYHLAKQRLRPGGVLQQWMQLHHTLPIDMFYVIGSIQAEFKYVWVYFIGGQGIIVATDDPKAVPSAANVQALNKAPGLRDTIEHFGGSAQAVADQLLLTPDEVETFLKSQGHPMDFFVSTDDNVHLEYSTPRGNVLDAVESARLNHEILAQFSQRAAAAAAAPKQP